jgi:hypothetical protein
MESGNDCFERLPMHKADFYGEGIFKFMPR